MIKRHIDFATIIVDNDELCGRAGPVPIRAKSLCPPDMAAR